MEAKALKTALKQARDAIQKKDFVEALAICETIAKTDPEHYVNNVMTGRCLFELERYSEAENAYMKAREVDEHQMLAWQGLAQLYEKEYVLGKEGELEQCYRKLIIDCGGIDDTKRKDIGLKLLKVVIKQNKLNEFYSESKIFYDQLTDDEKVLVGPQLLQMFPSKYIDNEDMKKFITDLSTFVLTRREQEDCKVVDVATKFAEIMLSNYQYQAAFESVANFVQEGSLSKAVKEIIFNCRIRSYVLEGNNQLYWKHFDDVNISFDDVDDDDEEDDADVDQPDADVADSWLACAVEVVDCLLDGDIVAAETVMGRCDDFQSKLTFNPYLNVLAGEVALKRNDFWKAEKYFRKGSKLMSDVMCSLGRVNWLLAMSLIGQDTPFALEAASLSLRSIIQDDVYPGKDLKIRVFSTLARCQIRQDALEDARSTLAKLKNLLTEYGNEGSEPLSADLEAELKEVEGMLELSEGHYQNAVDVACKAALLSPRSSAIQCLIGMAQLGLNPKSSDALKAFLLAAKLDSESDQAFEGLGRYYLAMARTSGEESMPGKESRFDGAVLRKAVKCLERAFQLNPRSVKIAEYLCQCHQAAGNPESQIPVLRSLIATQNPLEAKNAWLQLGRLYLTNSNCGHDAVTTLQVVARYYSDDNSVAEALAEAYKLRGSYETALKSYQAILNVILEQKTNGDYSEEGIIAPFSRNEISNLDANVAMIKRIRFQIAAILLTLNRFDEAAVAFETLTMQENGNIIEAKYGLVESLIRLAQQCWSFGLVRRSVDTMGQVFVHLNTMLPKKKEWDGLNIEDIDEIALSLLAETLLSLHVIPPDLLKIIESKSPSFLKDHETNWFPNDCEFKFDVSSASGESESFRKKCILLMQGCNAYLVCVQLRPDCAGYYVGLGLSQMALAGTLKSSAAPLTSMPSRSLEAHLLSLAELSLKSAIELEPNDPSSWINLAIVYSARKGREEDEDYATFRPKLAQHCCLKALELDQANASAWTILGLVYLSHDNIELAHKAFIMAQNAKPDYPYPWMGQAVIAEKTGHQDAMDLYRHCAILSPERLGLIGYSSHVLHTLLASGNDRQSIDYKFSIEKMFAVVKSLDCTSKAIELDSLDPYGLYLAGCMMELGHLDKPALGSYQKALEAGIKCEDQDLTLAVKLALCRVFGKLGLSQNMRRIGGRLGANTVDAISVRGLAYYNLEQFDKAEEAFSECYYLTESDSDKRDVAVAMALIKLTSGDVDGAEDALGARQNFDTCSAIHSPTCVARLLISVARATRTDDSRDDKFDTSDLKRELALMSGSVAAENWVELALVLTFVVVKKLTMAFGCWLVFHFPQHSLAWELLGAIGAVAKRQQSRPVKRFRFTYLPSSGNMIKSPRWLLLEAMRGDLRCSLQRLVHSYPDRSECWQLLRQLYLDCNDD